MERADGKGGSDHPAGDGRARCFAARLRKVNLDLLPVLHELLRTKSVTRTAQSFNMTQPAVSRALRQLRGALDDQLLVSSGRTAHLTDRAETLAGPLARTLTASTCC